MKSDGSSAGFVASAATDSVRLSSHDGQAVILNFWASWCLACQEEHAALSQAALHYRERGVRFYGILYQDTPGNARRWIKRMGGQSYPTLLDPYSRTAIDYGVYGVPETFVIDASGVVLHRHVSAVTERLLQENIEAALAPNVVPDG